MALPQRSPVYDPEDDKPVVRPNLRSIEGGGESDGKPAGSLKSVPAEDLDKAERSGLRGIEGGGESDGAKKGNLRLAGEEADRLGKGFTGEGKGGFLSGKSLSIKNWTKKKTATVAVVAVLGGGGMFGMGIIQGPMQIVQFAQRMQKFHLQRNEDFSDGRSSKILLYGAAGLGPQNGRLGMKGNWAANKWQDILVKKTGMRPVYSDKTGRFIGFEILDEDKAFKTLLKASDSSGRNTKKLERALGKGAEIRTSKEISDYRVRNANGGEVPENRRILDLSRVSFADRKAFIKIVHQNAETWRAASWVGGRLIVKRGGVNLHPMNKSKERLDKWGDQRKTKKEQKKKERAERITGEAKGIGGVTPDTPDGEPPDEGDIKASKETEELLEETKKNGFKKFAAAGVSGAAIAGVLCAAKGYGDGIEHYRFENNILPMMRMGMEAVSTGNQVMSMEDFDMDTLSMMSEYLYDKENKTSWNSAASIRAEEGREGGVPMPEEADLGKVGEKPKLFRAIDAIPVLGTVCSIQEGIFGLPIIKQVSGAVSSITTGLADAALSVGGTSTDELLLASMKAVSGAAVDPEAKGADFGNLANTGVFLAANDQAISTGGKAMSRQSAMEIRREQDAQEKRELQGQSFFARYLDPSSTRSLVGSTIYHMPAQTSDIATVAVGRLSSVFSAKSIVAFLPFFGSSQVSAAGSYDYGVPAYGFTLSEQEDDRFENPYENAVIVESKLEDLNNKYGECFGIKVTADDDGPHIETEKAANPFEIAKKSQCQDNSEDFLRYRFYLADAVNTLAIACYLADDENPDDAEGTKACADLGIGGAPEEVSSGDGLVSGDDQELAKKIVESSKFSGDSRYVEQIKQYSKGNSSCHINSTILQLIATVLDKGYSVYVSSLNRKCTNVLTASGTASYHYDEGGGHAVDFSIINGTATTGRDENARKLLKDILPGLPKGSGIGQVSCGPKVQLPSGVTEFEDSCDHLHIQVPKE